MLNRWSFLKAFESVWSRRHTEERKRIYDAYPSLSAWTDYILNSETGLLSEIAKHFERIEPEIAYYREVYTIDALFVGGPALFGTGLGYPSKLMALIEHENNDLIEEEMWKLLFWRSPLKILMCYDWNESEKTNASRRSWVSSKIDLLHSMLMSADDFHHEDPRTEYLLLIGNRSESNTLQWKWSSIVEKDLHIIGEE